MCLGCTLGVKCMEINCIHLRHKRLGNSMMLVCHSEEDCCAGCSPDPYEGHFVPPDMNEFERAEYEERIKCARERFEVENKRIIYDLFGQDSVDWE